MTIQKKAYAKINLYLKILNKREDNYHNIFTVMQKISLADEIKVKIIPGEKRISIDCSVKSIANEKNTAYKAAELFLARVKAAAGVNIEIEKKIPARAGLGGGSSDAAFVLLALNEYCGFVLPESELADIAARVGADVPFFLKNASCALCEGIGERVTPLEAKLSGCCLIAKPSCDISTKQAYEDWDKSGSGKPPPPKWEISKIFESIHNDFAELAFSQNINIQIIHGFIAKSGAAAAGLCGSGSALFGIFTDLAPARRCEVALRQMRDVEFCGVFDFL
ncbi:MAG: 4-(cytidine 5'-diphospho)-2-C-methyl-D-erythritol kinase [Oscillospiraceae bacterium]|nr:4-(cytidine 5'-diphospho)-2-C-methyl-D-erythritol kinase [Oscillospiraceae bacterium]